MSRVRQIERLNDQQLLNGRNLDRGSWHDDWTHSAWVYIGGLPLELTEGDVLCIFSQCGEPEEITMPGRDAKSGKSRGYCFLKYKDQRSTILAVDNLNGTKILGRTICVDHAKAPKIS